MKILHTSDWHLGKKLEGFSRLEEQEKFIDELIEITEREGIDIIVIAGDIYDVPSPSAEAEKLYFKGIKKLSNNGKRPIIVIAGNHDNPQKITASEPLARENGILTFGKPLEKKEVGTYGEFQVTKSCKGGVVINLDGKEVFINALPYPSERTLGKDYNIEGKDETYSQVVGRILKETQKGCPEGMKSIIVAHLLAMGKAKDNVEEEFELGGAQPFYFTDGPKVDYIALGHIHRTMVFKEHPAVYSGANLEYRLNEARYKKKVFIKDLEDGSLKEVELENFKPIKEYTGKTIEEGIEISKNLMDREEWIYLNIESERPLKNRELKEIKRNKNIVMITPIINWEENGKEELHDYSQEDIGEAFKAFYKKNQNKEPDQGVIDIFLELIGE